MPPLLVSEDFSVSGPRLSDYLRHRAMVDDVNELVGPYPAHLPWTEPLLSSLLGKQSVHR